MASWSSSRVEYSVAYFDQIYNPGLRQNIMNIMHQKDLDRTTKM